MNHDYTGHTPTASHDALDSLLYLKARSSVLDWISEEITGVYSDAPDFELCAEQLNAFVALIRAEIDVHGGPRPRYSTGNPVEVEVEGTRIVPDPDGGPDRLVRVPYVHACKPDGTVLGVDDATG